MQKYNVEEREEEILKLINQMVAKKGYPPTVREICKEVGLRSPSTVHGYLVKLKEKGLISSIPDLPRTITVETTRYVDQTITIENNDNTIPITFNLSNTSLTLLNQYCETKNISADEAIQKAIKLLAFIKNKHTKKI